MVVRLRQRLGRCNSAAGFTLAELLITSVAVLTVLQGLVFALLSQMRSVNAATTNLQTANELARLAYLMDAEVREGCAVQVGATPASCRQVCATTAANDLRVLIPVIDASGVPAMRSIRYYLASGQLFRSGPRILLNGQLDLRDLQGVNTLLLDEASGFTASTDSSCRISNVTVRVSTTNPQQNHQSSFALQAGVSSYTN